MLRRELTELHVRINSIEILDGNEMKLIAKNSSERYMSSIIAPPLVAVHDESSEIRSDLTKPVSLLPMLISYQCYLVSAQVRQILILESVPLTSTRFQGKCSVLLELADGRVFFFRTSLTSIRNTQEASFLFEELSRLPEWITDWGRAADVVGYAVGAPIEFHATDPVKIDSWNINEIKKLAASWVAFSQVSVTIQQINVIVSEWEKELVQTLSIRLDEFFSNIDQFSCSVHTRYHCSWQSCYSYFSHRNEQKRQYRRQVDSIFPLVLQQVLAKPNGDYSAGIIAAIDAGVPLVDYLAKLFNCSKKCIRNLNGLAVEDIGHQWEGRLKELLTILSDLDVNRLPRSMPEWAVFGDTVKLLSMMIKLPITALSSRLLLSELSKQNWKRKFDLGICYQERAQAIEQFSENIRQGIFATAWINGKDIGLAGGPAQRLAYEVACSLGLLRLEKLALKWRAEEIRLDSQVVPTQNDGFPVILESPLEVNDMKIIQLKNSLELSEEGASMSNCVGSYRGVCASGKTFIFSVRDKDGRSCVTLEYGLQRSERGLPELILIQKRGYENSKVHSRYNAALDLLKSYTGSSTIRSNLLNLIVSQRVTELSDAGVAKKYLRNLKFTQFLNNEYPGRFDFDKLVNEAVKQV